jgi:uncharacterized protein (TIGR02145 family)
MKKIFAISVFVVVFGSLSAQDRFTDKRDGSVYPIVTVGSVTWMTENLKFNAGAGSISYEKGLINNQKYGMLYDWKTALKVCPEGWHLPNGADFRLLLDHYEHGEEWGKLAFNPGSFNIQLSGMQDSEGTFSELEKGGYYWSSTDYDENNAEYFSYIIINKLPVPDISRKQDIGDIRGTTKTHKYSVRCVKD